MRIVSDLNVEAHIKSLVKYLGYYEILFSLVIGPR